MKAKFVFKQDGTVELKTITGVAGTTCTKKMAELQTLLPGQLDPASVAKTNDYYKTTESKSDINIDG